MTARRLQHWLGLTLTLLIAASVAAGLYLAGSPTEARLRRLDERRIDDLRSASQAINAYWNRRGSLPASLDSLADATSTTLRDPATGGLYAYEPTADGAYQLCADFARASEPQGHRPWYDEWRHPAGRHCFRLSAAQTR